MEPEKRPTFSELYANTTKYIEKIAGYLDLGFNPFPGVGGGETINVEEREEEGCDPGAVQHMMSTPHNLDDTSEHICLLSVSDNSEYVHRQGSIYWGRWRRSFFPKHILTIYLKNKLVQDVLKPTNLDKKCRHKATKRNSIPQNRKFWLEP